MRFVFLLQHVHLLPSGEEDTKEVGVYSCKSNAEAAVARLKCQPGFCDHPKIIDPIGDDEEQGFYISECELDKDNWLEGFVTMVADTEYSEWIKKYPEDPDRQNGT